MSFGGQVVVQFKELQPGDVFQVPATGFLYQCEEVGQPYGRPELVDVAVRPLTPNDATVMLVARACHLTRAFRPRLRDEELVRINITRMDRRY